MIDLSHIPEIPGLRVFLPQGVDANSWQTWQKPRGFVMATIYAIGPGGGGGSGRAATALTKIGGGGGGSGGLSRLTIPLFLLPDTLYIRVTPGGSGGAGVSADSNGNSGNVNFSPLSSIVSVYSSTTAQYCFLVANAGGGGVAGASTTGGGGGSAASISSTSAAPLGNLGATLFIAGNAGASGGVGGGVLGGNITQGTASQIYGGAGGGAQDSTLSGGGGSINALSNTPFGVSQGGTATGLNGGSGFSWSTIFPLKHYGGTGGRGSTTGTSGSGGNGCVPGTGGGGGAGAQVTSGRGGDGGPGCVIIQCW